VPVPLILIAKKYHQAYTQHVFPLRDDEDQDVLEDSRIQMEVLDWHEGQIVTWKTMHPMKVKPERHPSMPSWDHPSGHSEKNVVECILESLLLRARYGYELVDPVPVAVAPCGPSICPKKWQKHQMSNLEVVKRALFVLATGEWIRRRRHLEDLAQQTAKYGQPDLTDECYLQRKEQKKGEIVLLIN
jgi:hypothetical protein